jgi:hypothetical protein
LICCKKQGQQVKKDLVEQHKLYQEQRMKLAEKEGRKEDQAGSKWKLQTTRIRRGAVSLWQTVGLSIAEIEAGRQAGAGCSSICIIY